MVCFMFSFTFLSYVLAFLECSSINEKFRVNIRSSEPKSYTQIGDMYLQGFITKALCEL